KRLVVIGDVHGMFAELKELLEKIGYDRLTDHIVFTGDVVSKGPDSLKVVELARKEGASCVRGNQDDRILLHYKNYQARIGESDQANDDVDEGKDVSELSKKMRKEKKLARKMTEKQAAWLESCPLILRANKVKGMGNVLVVHAGLVHGIDLKEQDPFALMNMRSIHAKLRVPSANNNGMHWAKLWNTNERVRRHPTTVIYGHYAARGLDIRPLTKGLDTNCVRGGNLTAFVV
ncbi:Metallo-dependent phosphatase, partial [Wilcoxina mikolae CBS 423.85]